MGVPGNVPRLISQACAPLRKSPQDAVQRHAICFGPYTNTRGPIPARPTSSPGPATQSCTMSSTAQVQTLLNGQRGSVVAPGYQAKSLLDNTRNMETMVVAVEVASTSALPSPPASAGGEDRPIAVGGQGDYIRLSDGRQILDACGGAAVTCLGHGNQEVIDAMATQASQLTYAAHGFFDNNSRRDLAEWFKATSQGHFRKVWVTNSGQ